MVILFSSRERYWKPVTHAGFWGLKHTILEPQFKKQNMQLQVRDKWDCFLRKPGGSYPFVSLFGGRCGGVAQGFHLVSLIQFYPWIHMKSSGPQFRVWTRSLGFYFLLSVWISSWFIFSLFSVFCSVILSCTKLYFTFLASFIINILGS